MRHYLKFLTLLICVSIHADASNPYWPQWRGPQWNGVAPEGNPPVVWSETENLKWKIPIEGSGWSTPIVWGDRVFLHTAIPLDRKLPVPDVIPPDTPNIGDHPAVATTWKAQRLAIICLDRFSGEQLWTRIIFEGMPHQGHHRKGGFASE